MLIALKTNAFDNRDVQLELTPTNRHLIAGIISKNAVHLSIPPDTPNLEVLDIICRYLKNNQNHIVCHYNGNINLYYLYKPRMHKKHMPTLRLVNVDVSKPWIILNDYDIEFVAQLEDDDNNQKIPNIIP